MLANTAIILAGGKSSRMGIDKQKIMINGVYLIDIIIDKLRKEFDEIIVVTNDVEFYKDRDVLVFEDEIKGKGPLSGIHVGLKHSSSDYSYVIACDMPYINSDFIKYQKSILNNQELLVTKYKGFIEPFSGFYKSTLIEKVYQSILDEKLSLNKFINENTSTYISEEKAREFSEDVKMFINLNTRDDLEDYIESVI